MQSALLFMDMKVHNSEIFLHSYYIDMFYIRLFDLKVVVYQSNHGVRAYIWYQNILL